MRICFFGTYTVAEGYPVNRFLLKGLRQAGVQVEECREELWEGFLHSAFSQGRGRTYLRLGRRALGRYLRLVWRYWHVGEHQCVIVGYAGYADIVLARLLNLCRKRLLVLVAFISLYDTIVVDRQQVRAGSWTARTLKAIDRMAFACADLVLVDTREQIAYFADLFGFPVGKFWRSFVGHEFDRFEPAALPASGQGKFQVLFFGTYVPLHGVEVILEAAEILREEDEVEFTLIGSGQLYPEIRQAAEGRKLANIRFIDGWMGAAELAERVRAAAACLGVFGQTPKAARVIPYKVFGALALQKPVITRDSPAVRELLEDGETALLCAAGDAQELAQAVLKLRDRPGLAARLAARGHAVYRTQASPEAVGRNLLQELERRLGS